MFCCFFCRFSIGTKICDDNSFVLTVLINKFLEKMVLIECYTIFLAFIIFAMHSDNYDPQA